MSVSRTSLYTSCLSGESCRVFDHVRSEKEGEKVFDAFLSDNDADPTQTRNALANLNDGRSTSSESPEFPSKKRV